MPCTLSVQPQKSKVSRKKEELLDAQNTKLVEKKKQVIRLGGNMRERKSLDNKFRNAEDDEKELVEMRKKTRVHNILATIGRDAPVMRSAARNLCTSL